MTADPLRDAVAWTVEDTPRELAVARGVTGALGVVLTLVTAGGDSAGRSAPTWDLPHDPDAFLDLGPLVLTGRASWLPDRSRHLVRATQRDAWLAAGRGERPTVPVPLQALRVTGARSRSRSRRPRHAGAPWTLTLTDGTGELQLAGAWLSLAWLGHLAGWPEPSPGQDP